MTRTINKKCEVYKVRLLCDCGGEMFPDGIMYACNPPKYPHKCKNCGFVENRGKTFPCIEHIEEEV